MNKHKETLLSYGYRHWTLESLPRCFYVGKGKVHRPFDTQDRSKKWKSVVERYGLRVEVCIGPIEDVEAIQWEIRTIQTESTFTTSYTTCDGLDIGCNFTLGGDGAAGYQHTDAHKHYIASRLRGNQHTKGRVRPQSERDRISAKQQIITSSDVTQILELSSAGIDWRELVIQFKCSYPVLRRVLRGTYKARR